MRQLKWVPSRRVVAWGALGLALLVAVGLMLRVQSRRLPTVAQSSELRSVGSFHVHSADSHDSDVPLEDIAAAAQQIGLDFVVLTDHNKQRTRALLIDGLAVLSYAELSTRFGHVVQLGASFALDGATRNGPNVFESIRAAGGKALITHPTDLKRPWIGPFEGAGGLEIVNLAAAARRAARPEFVGLLPALIAWPLNHEVALSQLIDRDDAALKLLDAHPDPHFVGICGTDAHGWIPVGLNMRSWLIVLNTHAPAGDARTTAVLDALRQGHFHCATGLLGRDPRFYFAARRGGTSVAFEGDSIAAGQVHDLAINGPATPLAPAQIVLFKDGVELTHSAGDTLVYDRPGPGTYRVEIRMPLPGLWGGNRWVPVIYSNRLRIVAA